jgi:hypothetical protein
MTGEFEQQLDEAAIIHTASAIADRDVTEIIRTYNVMDGGVTTVTFDPQALKEAALVRASQYIQAIETPADRLDSLQFVGALSGKKAQTQLKLLKEEMIEATAMTDEDAAEVFKKEFTAAKKVARTYGVQVSDVYIYDELYFEMQREATTLDEQLARYSTLLNAFTEDAYLLIELRNMEQTVLEMDPDVDREYLSHMLLIFQVNPDFTHEIRILWQTSRARICKMFESTIQRIWGDAALDSLPGETKTLFGIEA